MAKARIDSSLGCVSLISLILVNFFGEHGEKLLAVKCRKMGYLEEILWFLGLKAFSCISSHYKKNNKVLFLISNMKNRSRLIFAQIKTSIFQK
jgi:hypothetical protein